MDRIRESCKVNGENYTIIILYCNTSNSYNSHQNHTVYIYIHFDSIPEMFHSVQFSRSVVSDSCDPMNHSTPGLPVHHQLLAFTQIQVHRVSDAIQPSHPLSSPSPPVPKSLPASESFPVSQLFARGGQSIGVSVSASVLLMNTQG